MLPVRRLPADFFRLETRIAGNMLQKLTNYRMKCAIVGDISAPLAASARCATSCASPTRAAPSGSPTTWTR